MSTIVHAIDLGLVTVEDQLPAPSITTLNEDSYINNQTLSQKLFNSVNINETENTTNANVISIRGNNYKATDYYEDGIPLYRTSSGFVDLSLYTANNTVVSINAGGAQGLYAPSATGGEIILTSKNIKHGFHTSLDATLSTNDVYTNILLSNKKNNWYWTLELNSMKRNYYKLSDDFSYTNIQPSDKRVNSDKEQLSGSFKIGYSIDSFSDIAFKVSHLKSKYGIPIQVYDEPSNAFDTKADYTRVDDKQLTSYWFYYDYKKNDTKLTFRAYYDEYKDIYNFYNTPELNTFKYDTSTYYDSRLGAITSLKYAYTKKQEGSFSIRVDRNRHRQVIINNPVKKDYEAIESSLSYLHGYQISDDFLITGSLKYKKQNLTKVYQFTTQNYKYKNNSAIDIQLTTNYKVNNKQSYYLSVARKNRFASLSELYPFFPWDTPNTNLKPEKSNSIEIGSSINLLEDTSIDLSFFYNSIENMIVYENSTYSNLEEATLQGFELKIYNYTFDNQDIELSYAYTSAEDKDGNKIVQTPKSKLLLQDTIEFNTKAKLAATYLYVSSRDDIYNSSRYSLSSYSLFNMQFSYKTTDKLLLKTGVKNLLDKNWEYKHGQPAEGRSFFIGLNYKY